MHQIVRLAPDEETRSRSGTNGRPVSFALSQEQREELLEQLERGASLPMACHQLGLPPADVMRLLDEDVALQEAVDEAQSLLSHNVAAALYQSAMKGSVPAQTYWLNHRPLPGWTTNSQKGIDAQPLADLTDEEVIELARDRGIAIPGELEP